jgi:hypothetical protein
MLDYRIWQAVGIFIIVGGLFLLLIQALRNHRPLLRQLGFVSLSAVSLVFVLSAINHFGTIKQSPYFVELGQFFPKPDKDNPLDKPPVTIGDTVHDPDVLLDGFEGLVTIAYEQSTGSGDEMSRLVVAASDLKQPLTVYEVSGDEKKSPQVIRPEAPGQVVIPVSSPALFKIALESSDPAEQSRGNSLAFEVQLRAENATLTVYRPKPFRIIPLAGLPEWKNEKDEDVYRVRISDNSAPASAARGVETFLATVSVAPGKSSGNVRTFLELPVDRAASGEEGAADFVINNGLTKLGYSYGTEVPIGSRRGALITVEAPTAPVGRWMLVVALLWLLPALFFLGSTFIPRANGLWVLLPLVQMLLASRMVLSLRAYLFPPYNAEGVEGAVFGELFIPLMLFVGLFSVLLRLLPEGTAGRADLTRGNPFGRTLKFLSSFPPFYYWLSALVVLPAVFYYLQTSTQRASYLFKSAAAFEWGDFWQPFLILLFVPPAFCALSALAHRWLSRAFRRSVGAEFGDYGSEKDEAITYALENPQSAAAPAFRAPAIFGRVPVWAWWIGLLLLCGVTVGSLWLDQGRAVLGVSLRGLVRGLAGVGVLIAIWHLRGATASWSRTVSVALEGLLIVIVVVVLLNLLHLFGLRSREVLLRWVPMRTSAAIQLLGFVLTMRLLAVFFHQDWKHLDDPLRGRGLWGFFAVFVSPLLYILIPSLGSGDLGAILVNWPPLLGMVLLVTGASVFIKRLHGVWRSASVGLSLLLLGGVLVVFWGTDKVPGLSHKFVDEVLVKNMPKETITHRIVLREGQVRAEGAVTAGGGEKLVRAMEQMWKMLHYAAHGGRWGYEEDNQPAIVPVPEGKWYSNGVPRDQNANFAQITLSDAVFSTYVLGEHGLWGGVCLLLLYFLFFVVVSTGALQSFPDSIMRITLLVGVALSLVYPAIYVAAANVNGAVFTGQDMPLLGLRSYTDLLHAGVLLALLAAALAPAGVTGESAPASSVGRRIAKRNLILVGLLVLFPVIWTVWCLRDVSVVSRDKYLQPFNLGHLNEKLKLLIKQESIKIKGGTDNLLNHDRWATRSIAGDLVTEFVNKYNARPEGERGDNNDQTQWFRIDKKLGRLTVNERRYYQPSPFRKRREWVGALTEGNKKAADALSGMGVSLRLYHRRFEEAVSPDFEERVEVNLSAPAPDYKQSSKFFVSDNVSDGGGGQRLRKLFTLYTMPDAEGAVLEPTGDPGLIYLNGVSLSAGGKQLSVRLDYGDTVAVAEREGETGAANEPGSQPRYLFTYQREEVATFSYVAWFNGVQQRVYPQRGALPSALLIAEAVEREASRRNQDLPLTLDSRLNGEVHKLLLRWRGEAGKVSRLPKLPEGVTRRIGVTLMNPDNGDVLALASDSGAVYDPEDDDDASKLRNRPDLANTNFARHIIGSTVKPLTAAATLYSFPSLTKMTITDNRQASNRHTVFGRPLGEAGRPIAMRRKGQTVAGWDDFLGPSDNLYAVALGLMGLTVDDESGFVQFPGAGDGQGLQVQIGDDPVRTTQPRFVDKVFYDDEDKRYYVDELESTPLAKNYQKLFDVNSRVMVNDYDTGVWENAEKLGLLDNRPDNNNLYAISPERTNLSLNQITRTWELRSILLGGGIEGPERYGSIGSEWCNLLQAQALARIVTGKEVRARLVVNPDQEPFPEWARGRHPSEPWRLDLLRGLQSVASQPGGTAYGSMHTCIDHLNAQAGGTRRVGDPGGRYFTLFAKTGTLKEDDEPSTVADSMFMFAAGIWDEGARRLEDPIVGVVYVEQGGGSAQRLGRELLRIIDGHKKWGQNLGQREPCAP